MKKLCVSVSLWQTGGVYKTRSFPETSRCSSPETGAPHMLPNFLDIAEKNPEARAAREIKYSIRGPLELLSTTTFSVADL
jgi:hypothetical protein